MACLINSGYTLGCRDNIGGVRRIYIASYDVFAEYTYAVIDLDTNPPTAGTPSVGVPIPNSDITAKTTTASAAESDYHTFEQETESASFSQAGTYSTENGTVFFDQQIGLIFHKTSTALRNQLLILSQANLIAIVEDQRGQFWLVGKENGLRAISGAMNTGKAFGDMNGAIITLQGKESEPAFRIFADDEVDLVAAGFAIVAN